MKIKTNLTLSSPFLLKLYTIPNIRKILYTREAHRIFSFFRVSFQSLTVLLVTAVYTYILNNTIAFWFSLLLHFSFIRVKRKEVKNNFDKLKLRFLLKIFYQKGFITRKNILKFYYFESFNYLNICPQTFCPKRFLMIRQTHLPNTSNTNIMRDWHIQD